jgi:alkylation response protein AidB-like acyl-CoA dehydrogenase
MNLDFSDDQRMLKDSIDRLVNERYAFDKRRNHAAEPRGFSEAVWREMAKLGLTMLPFGEALGGLGLGGVEMMIIGEAVGRGLLLEPYLPSIVLAGTAIAEGAAADIAEMRLAGIMSGETIAALADQATITAAPEDDGVRLNGVATLVLGGDHAGLFVLPAGDAAWIVPAETAGLNVRGYRLHGGGGAADLTLRDVRVDATSRIPLPAVTRAIEAGIAFLAAEASGAMRAALDVTVDYLKTREQFGKPIGVNQALQHRAAEMLVEVEQAISAAIYAALLASEGDPAERARGTAAIKAVVGKTGRFVAQCAVQLHGGLGVSEEHVVSHYFRRLTAIGMLLGGTDMQLKTLAALGGFTGSAAHHTG